MEKVRTNIKPKIKKHVSEYNINLGVLNFKTALLPMKVGGTKSAKPTYKNLSPDKNPVMRVWRDTETGKVWEESDLLKGHEDKVEGEITILEAEEVAKASKSTLAKNYVSLTVHKTADVQERLFTSDHSAYVVQQPVEKKALEAYNTLYALVSEFPEYTLLGASNVKGYDGLYKLSAWRGQLVIVRMLYPSMIEDHEVIEHSELSDKNRAVANAMLSKLCVDFDADNYEDLSANRHLALLSGETVTETAEETENDMFAMLGDLYA